MLNKIIEQQLNKVQNADLSNYNPETNTYFIKKRIDIKLEEDKGYIIYLKDSAFTNTTIINNWNNGSFPKTRYLKIDIIKKMNNMIKINSIEYNLITKQNLDKHWSGWLCVDNLDIIEKLM